MVDYKTWHAPYAVTLTLKKARPTPEGWERATRETYAKNLRHFLNILNAKSFSSYDRRGKRRLRCFATLEPDGSGRLHYHLLLEKSPTFTEADFALLIERSWSKTNWGYDQIDVRPAISEGWVSYMIKHEFGSDAFAIDWDNTHLH